MQIGERIRWLRKRQGLTIEGLASLLGVTRQTVSRYETGAITDIPAAKLDIIAKNLGVSIAYLLGVTPESQIDSIDYEISLKKSELNRSNDIEEQTRIEQEIAALEKKLSAIFIDEKLKIPSKERLKRPNEIDAIKVPHALSGGEKKTVTLKLNTFLYFSLKYFAAESGRSIEEEIQLLLYEKIEEMNKPEEKG